MSPPLLEQHYLIRPNRTWAEITKARERLAGLSQQKPYEGMESDALDVENYANVLRQSSRTIALAICLGAHLRRFAPGNRFEDAMKALSSGLEFQFLDDATKRSELERCARDLFGVAMPQLAELDLVGEDITTGWLTALKGWLGKVNDLTELDSRDIRRGAWAAWTSRLEAFSQGRDDPADLNYLRCRAEGSPAGTCLPARLSRVGLGQLSDALTAALALPDPKDVDEAKAFPASFVLNLLVALRFDVNDLNLRKDPELADFYASYQPATSPVKGLIVVRSPAGSVTTNWKVSPTVPAICIPLDHAGLLLTGRKNFGTLVASRIHGILFEVDQIDTLSDRAPSFQALMNRFPAEIRPAAGLLTSANVPNRNIVPDGLRRVAVAPIDQSQAVAAFTSP